MDFFTSDLHIGHDKEFIWGARGFDSVEEHDSEILRRWNSTVTPKDNVYILGDLVMGTNESEWDRIFSQLNGTLIFVAGNHDTDHKIDYYCNNYDMIFLGWATPYHYSKYKHFYLSHYPTLVSNFEDKKFVWNLSGHTHSQDKFEYGRGHVYNVALDAHNCYPVSIEDIIKDITEYNKKLKGKNE